MKVPELVTVCTACNRDDVGVVLDWSQRNATEQLLGTRYRMSRHKVKYLSRDRTLPFCKNSRIEVPKELVFDRKTKGVMGVEREEGCVCGGKRAVTWHYDHKIKPCQPALDKKNEVARSRRKAYREVGVPYEPNKKRYRASAGKRRPPWQPGTVIYVEEIEEL